MNLLKFDFFFKEEAFIIAANFPHSQLKNIFPLYWSTGNGSLIN